MNTGKIKKLVRDRGFGFISDTDGREVFFHRNALVEAKFEDLTEEQSVSYDIEKSDKGPRAVNVRIA
ncbi:MAG: cold shock domain-containing protein [Candidatus Omnitrophica bacterium]|jgi:CspA family cold shock protein|nr:cold shock domain-containing protein [Candidatus Omnitrophota bacterium]